jgi:hypothetical protein
MGLDKFVCASSIRLLPIVLLVGILVGSTVVIGQSTGASTENLFEAKLGKPLYMEHYKVTRTQNTLVDGKNATLAFFSGNGTLNGIAIKSSGKALVIPRSNGKTYDYGTVNYTSADNSNERATEIFQAIGSGKSASIGSVIFDENATGKLKILSNLVGIYKTQGNANGTGTFVMWEWK